MNSKECEYNEANLRKYIEKCFKDAFKSEEREYNPAAWEFEWVMVKNNSDVYQLYDIHWCKYARVLNRVLYRLKKNLYKNFGIIYGNSDDMRCILDKDDYIDFNFQQARFKYLCGTVGLRIFDSHSVNGKHGECMGAYKYEKLVFTYWGIDADIYRGLAEDDERGALPAEMRHNWEKFRDLYNRTFETPLGSYDIIWSSGLQRV